jgi:hypothetical protein
MGQDENKESQMSSTQEAIEDAIIALSTEHADVYGEPFFRSTSCELERGFAEHLAEELTKLGYDVSVVDDYTVSWERPPDEYHIGSRPRLRVRSATDEDLERDFGSAKLLIGFPVRPERESQRPTTADALAEGDEGD